MIPGDFTTGFARAAKGPHQVIRSAHLVFAFGAALVVSTRSYVNLIDIRDAKAGSGTGLRRVIE